MAKTYGVIAIKGGVGKTTAVVNIGAALAKVYNKKTLIVDGNFSAPNLGIHLGVVNPDVTMHEVLSGKVPITQAIYKHEMGFDYIPSSLIHKKIDVYKLKQQLEHIKDQYDIILVDSSPNLNHEMLSAMVASDELLVVTTPDYPTLSATMNAVRVAKIRKTPISGLILNKVRNEKFELSLDEIEETTNTPVLAVLGDDVKVLQSLSETVPYSVSYNNRDGAVELIKLAGSLIGQSFDDNRFKSKVRRVFKPIDRQEINRNLYRENAR